MRSPVFGNEFFDQWLNQRSNEILNKVEREKFSNDDMMILSLKAQVNHFHHMDIEFRDEFKNIQKQFAEVDRKFQEVYKQFEQVNIRFEQVDKRFEQVDKRFEQVDKRFEQVDKRFEQVDNRFEQVDKRFDQLDLRLERMTNILTWGFGIIATGMLGLFFKGV